MATVAFRTTGPIATDNATTTLNLTAPSAGVIVDDVFVAIILCKNNQVVTAPAGWTKFVEVDNTANQRVTLAWKRVTAPDIGAGFAFTKPVDDNLLFGGIIACFKSCITTGSPIDTTAPTTSANASSDTVAYADFNPTATNALVVAVGVYCDDQVSPAVISGTNPVFVSNFKEETTSGTDWSVFGQSGASDGAATGARSHASSSVNDAINVGVLFGLLPDPALYGVPALAVTRDALSNFSNPIPTQAKPAYLTPVTAAGWGTKLTRIGGDPGAAFSYTELPLPGTVKTGAWGSRARHRYSVQQPWNADESLIWIDNVRSGTNVNGTPKRLLLDGTTYAVKYGLGPQLDAAFWDVRWHPLDPTILINVTQDGTKLQWWNVLADTKVREWNLPLLFGFPAEYGVGSATGNVSDDGKLILIVSNTQIAVLDMSVYPEVKIGAPYTFGPNPGQDHGGMSGSGLYAFVNFNTDCGGNGEQMQVFDVNQATLALTPRNYSALGGPTYAAFQAIVCNTTTGSPAVTSAALFAVTPSIEPGMVVTGPGIPANTHVLSIADASNLVLDKNVTTPAGAQTLTFTDDYANGYIRRMGHEDCFRNPFDSSKDYLAGQNQGGGTGTVVDGKTISHVNRIKFETGVLDPLTIESGEATSHHISARNIFNPGFVCVTWFESATNQRQAGEACMIAVDGSTRMARFCHCHSNTPGVYQAEKHGVASPVGRRIMFASNWALQCGGTCGNAGVNGDQQSYVVEGAMESGYAIVHGVASASGELVSKAELRRSDAPMIALIKVYLPSPSVKTLYLASNYIETPDPWQLWEGIIVDLDPIRAPGSFLSTGPDLCTAGFSVATRGALGFQVGEFANLSELFKSWRWLGAKVEIYLWSQRMASFTNQAVLLFTGNVLNYQIKSDSIHVSLVQRTDWQKIISPIMVTRDRFPRAPDRTVGKALPIVYGAVRSLEMHEPPWTAPYSAAVHDLEHIFGGQIGMPAVCVDTGRGGANQRAEYLIAGHPIKSHNEPSTEVTTYFVKQNDVLVPIEIGTLALATCGSVVGWPALSAGPNDFLASGIKIGMPVTHPNIPAGAFVTSLEATVVYLATAAGPAYGTATGNGTATFVTTPNGPAGAGFQIADDFKTASYPIAPADVLAGISQPADDLRMAIDTSDVSFARYSYQTAVIDKRRGEWILPDVATPGDYMGLAYIRILYKSTAALTSFKVGIRKGGNLTLGTLAPSTTPTRASISVGDVDWGSGGAGSPFPAVPWAFSECTLIAYWDLFGVPAGREDVYIYSIGLEVVYRPKAKVFAPAYVITPGRKYRRWPITMDAPARTSLPDTEIESEFFGTAEGYADDTGGTFTGVIAALIERPCDIAHHAFRTYCSQLATKIETTAGAFGSFVDARTSLLARGLSLRSGLCINDITDAETIISDLAESGHAWAYIDRFTDKWHWVPWTKGAGSDYARKVWRDDMVSFQIEAVPSTRIPSGIRVQYAYDPSSRQYLKSTHVSANGSGGGHKYQDIRDEQDFKVTADVNDRFDFATSGGFTAVLTPGAYATGHALAKELDARLEALAPNDFMVCYGTTIETGYNDKLNVNDGAVKTATVAGAVYASMDAQAVAVAAALNAVSTGWTCVYNRATRKFTIDRTSGTKILLTNSGANRATSCYTSLGYNTITDWAAGTVAQHQTEEEIFQIAALDGAMDLLFKTGTYGSDAAAPKNCAELFGFTAIYDRDAAGSVRQWTADCPRNNREKALADAGAAYGQTRERVIELRSVYDTPTAREVRNRTVDWLANPPLIIRFSTFKMPDVRRGELLRFDDLDDFAITYPKQGSDGRWTGKRFRVVSVQQRLGPSFDQEIEAIEND